VAVANPGRVAAARALVAVDDGAHAEDALASLAPEAGNDRGLAWFLVLGVLRHRGQVDASLRPHLTRPLQALDPEVRAILRFGAYEKLFSRTAPHAVVHQAVEVAHALRVSRAQGVVNAVLRKVVLPTDLSQADDWNHPEWLVERWVQRYGDAATAAWCRGNTEVPPLTVVGTDERIESHFQQRDVSFRAVELFGRTLPRVWRVEGHEGPVPDLPGFEEGLFWVQDPASVAVADLVGVKPGWKVLDACAAPGGKTFRLCSQGAEVTALDRDPRRIELLLSSCRRLGYSPRTRVHDWSKGSWSQDKFDAVLVDAPCTALGTLRRHPEVRWRRFPEDIPVVQEKQLQILHTASSQVRSGGVLVYAVCSPEPEEGTELVRKFLAENPAFVLDQEWSTAPPAGDEDAFYGARMVRE